MTCKDCVFGVKVFPDLPKSDVLRCHRYPPNTQGHRPIVTLTDWCGEFQPVNVSADE